MSSASSRANRQVSIKRTSVEQLVLYVAAKFPSPADMEAEAAVKALAVEVEICRVDRDAEISTPRLLAGKSFYRGLESIRGYLSKRGYHKRFDHPSAQTTNA